MAENSIPKFIWMYWHQGFVGAPEIVKYCVESWRYHNPGWRVMLVDQYNLSEYIAPLDVPVEKLEKLQLQHRSDLIRTKLLIEHGGVWADPTCYCARPLNDWLPQQLRAGLFFFHRPGRDRIIANWFIATSEKDNIVLGELYKSLCNYWTENNFRNYKREKGSIEQWINRLINRNEWLPQVWFSFFFKKILQFFPYMVYHYMFYFLVMNDRRCKEIWKSVPIVSALECLRLQRIGLIQGLTSEGKTLIDSRQVPLFKLVWKLEDPAKMKGTLINYLINAK